MGILSENPKEEPMHYGEVFGVWSSLSVAKGQLVKYQVFLNHAGDQDLKKLINDTIQNVVTPAIKESEQLLKMNGIGLPPTPPERSEADLEDIPTGARIMDPEISATVFKDLAQGLIADSQVIGECVREDIATLFTQGHTNKARMRENFLQLNKDKGWLVPPPLHAEAVPQ